MNEQTTVQSTVIATEPEYDSISITSTVISEGEEDDLYNVECILNEMEDEDGKMWYLVDWEGYPIEVSTWEPESNIEDETTLRDWSDRKMRITRGLEKPFDQRAFDQQVIRFEQAKVDRKKRRRAKRKRLDIPVSQSPTPEADRPVSTAVADDGNSSDEDSNGVAKVKHVLDRQSANKHPGVPERVTLKQLVIEDNAEDEGPENELLHSNSLRRVSRINKEQANTANLSDDLSVGEQKARARRRDQKKLEKKGHKVKTQMMVMTKKTIQSLDRDVGMQRTSPSPRLTPPVQPLSHPEQQPSERRKSLVDMPQAKIRSEAPSRTGYQGTANRAAISRPLMRNARNSTHGHGRGAIRGGHANLRPSFTTYTAPVERRSLQKALLEPRPHKEHFKTPSMRRKVELAGRSLQDRAPDLSSIILVNPSEHRTFSKIPKKSQQTVNIDLRRNSESAAVPHEASVTVADAVTDNLTPSLEEPESVQSENTGGHKHSWRIAEQPQDDKEVRSLLVKKHNALQAEIQARKISIDSHPNRSRPKLDRAHTYPTNTTNVTDRTTFINLTHVSDAINNSTSDLNLVDPNKSPCESTGNATTTHQAYQAPKTITKVTFNDYQHQRKSDLSTDSIIVKGVFGNAESQSALLTFSGINKQPYQSWIHDLQNRDEMRFDRTCLAEDLRTQFDSLQLQMLANGNIMTDSSGGAIVDQVAEMLRPTSCVVFAHTTFTILLFPTKCEEWKFLEMSSLTLTDSALRYHIFEPTPLVSHVSDAPGFDADTTISSINLTSTYMETLVAKTLGLDYKQLLSGKESSSFYLMFPPTCAMTANFLEKWLKACKPGSRIFTSQNPGAWRIFTEQTNVDSCSVFIHESLVPKLFQIPHLTRLWPRPFTFWCVSDASFAVPLYRSVGGEEDAFPAGTTLARLFPHGGAVFMTPTFLMTEPEKTYELLTYIINKTQTSTPGTWKLLGCHKLKQFLLDVAVQKADARRSLLESLPADEAGKDEVAASKGLSYKKCERWFLNHTLLDNIMTKELMTGYPNMWDDDDPDEMDCPILYADENIDQYDEEQLVEWYAGWTMSRLDLFRKFIVVGTTPSMPVADTVPNHMTTSPSGELAVKDALAVLKSKSLIKSTVSQKPTVAEAVKFRPQFVTELSGEQPKLRQSSAGSGSLKSVTHAYESNHDPLMTKKSQPDLPWYLDDRQYRQDDTTSSLWLGDLPFSTSDGQLLDIFQKYGPIISVRNMTHRGTFAFVNFQYTESAIHAKALLENTQIFPGERPVKINYAKVPPGHVPGPAPPWIIYPSKSSTDIKHQLEYPPVTKAINANTTVENLFDGKIKKLPNNSSIQDSSTTHGNSQATAAAPMYSNISDQTQDSRETAKFQSVTDGVINADTLPVIEGNKNNDLAMQCNKDSATINTAQNGRPRHGIDADVDMMVLTFIALTGSDRETAEFYLKRHHGIPSQAVQDYVQSANDTSCPGLSPADYNDNAISSSTILEFIASTNATPQEAHRLLGLAHEDVKRAIEIYQSGSNVGSSRQPSNLDRDDARENTGNCQPQLIGGANRHETSKLGSPVTVSKRSNVGQKLMAYHEGEEERLAKSNGTQNPEKEGSAVGVGMDNYTLSIKETTTEWYEKRRAKGHGWEHIHVCGWESCFRSLGLKQTSA